MCVQDKKATKWGSNHNGIVQCTQIWSRQPKSPQKKYKSVRIKSWTLKILSIEPQQSINHSKNLKPNIDGVIVSQNRDLKSHRVDKSLVRWEREINICQNEIGVVGNQYQQWFNWIQYNRIGVVGKTIITKSNKAVVWKSIQKLKNYQKSRGKEKKCTILVVSPLFGGASC